MLISRVRRAGLVVLLPGDARLRPLARAATRYATVVTSTQREADELAGRGKVVPKPTPLEEPPGPNKRLVAVEDSSRMRLSLTRAPRGVPELPALILRLSGERVASRLVRCLETLPLPRLQGLGARLALAADDIEFAERLSRRVLSGAPATRGALAVEAALLERAGEPSAALAAARAAGDHRTARRLKGRLRTFDVPASERHRSPPGESARPRRALVLLETSLPHSATGYAFRSAALVQALSRAGLDPVVVTRLGFPASRGVTDFSAVEYVDGVVHHRLWIPGARRYTAIPLDAQLAVMVHALEALVRRAPPSLIWASTPHLNGLAGLAIRDHLGVPLIYDVRGFPELTWEAEHGGPSELSAARRAAETSLMHAADRVVTLGEVMRTQICSRHIAPPKTAVLPHLAANAVRGGRSTRTGPPTIGLATTLRRYEGVDVLLNALGLLRARGIPVQPLVLGDGPELLSLRRLADELGFDPRAALPGRVPAEEARRLVAEMTLVVVPRRDESVCRLVVPLKPVEAMVSGCPLVLSELPALEELGGDGRARLVPPGDAAALAHAIAVDLADTPGRTARATRAAEWVQRHHSAEAIDTAMRTVLVGLDIRQAIEQRD